MIGSTHELPPEVRISRAAEELRATEAMVAGDLRVDGREESPPTFVLLDPCTSLASGARLLATSIYEIAGMAVVA